MTTRPARPAKPSSCRTRSRSRWSRVRPWLEAAVPCTGCVRSQSRAGRAGSLPALWPELSLGRRKLCWLLLHPLLPKGRALWLQGWVDCSAGVLAFLESTQTLGQSLCSSPPLSLAGMHYSLYLCSSVKPTGSVMVLLKQKVV